MRQTFRICLSSTTALVAVILVLALSANASPASPAFARREDLGHQTTFSIGHHHEQELLAVGATNEVEDYTGYAVWRLSLLGGQQVQDDGLDAGKAAKHVMEVARLLDLDIWHASRSHVDILLSPKIKSHFFSLLPRSLHPTSPLVDTDLLQTLLSRPHHRHHRRPPPSQPPIPSPPIDPFNLTTLQSPYHDAYHSLSNITEFGKQLEKTFPGLVKRFIVGKSAEGRDVEGLRLHKFVNTTGDDEDEIDWSPRTLMGRRKGNVEEAKTRVFYLQGGQHAREWIAPSSLLYFAHHLLVQAAQFNTHIVHLLETYEFIIVPTINPDGYEYSRDHSRLWRKNRQDLDYRNCKGIDMNSNWGYQWSPNMMASNPCSEAYPGSAAFEAVETKLVADFLEEIKEIRDVRAFVDIHSYGQLFMFPYAYSCSDFPGDAETLMEAGLGVAKAMRNTHGTVYQAGQACDLVYRMSGDSIDYAYGSAKIRWSYSVELRDTGTFGFLLPPSLIRETATEVTEGLVYLAKFINTIEGFE